MERNMIIIIVGIIIASIIIGYIVFIIAKDIINITKKKPVIEKKLENKKILMVLAFKNFRDAEYFVPRQILEKAGAEIKTASNEKGTALGADGGEVKIDYLVSELDLADFDAIVFIGGSGCLEALDNEDSYAVINKAISEDKVLAAICISPIILAKTGALEGKKATVWTSLLDKTAVQVLNKNGAIYQEQPVVVDGKIITGSGPAAAKAFGQAIIQVLTKGE